MTTRLSRSLAIGLFVAGAMAHAAPSEAVPVQYGANFYELVLTSDPFPYTGNTWSAASSAAAASIFLGVSGHLATITSAGENAFLLSLAPATTSTFVGAWLGGTATTTSPPNQPGLWLEGPETGQTFPYVNWGGIEPNNAGYAFMNIGTGINLGADGSILSGQWADDSGVNGTPGSSDPVRGYFIEYESPLRGVPAPATVLLVALGLGVMAARRRR